MIILDYFEIPGGTCGAVSAKNPEIKHGEISAKIPCEITDKFFNGDFLKKIVKMMNF